MHTTARIPLIAAAVIAAATATAMPAFAGGSKSGGKSFDKGCTVKAGAGSGSSDNKYTCRNLDRHIDGGDGPDKGVVRGKDG